MAGFLRRPAIKKIGRQLNLVARRAPRHLRRQAVGLFLGSVLPRLYPPEHVLNPQNLLEVIIALYLAIPPAWRFVAHEVIEAGLDAWLKDGALKAAMHEALNVTHFATEKFLDDANLDADMIRARLGPKLEERFLHHTSHSPGGPVADAHTTTTTAPPAPPPNNFFDKLAELKEPTQLFVLRITALGELGSRPGRDDNPQVEGVAAMLRTACIEMVENSKAKGVDAMLVAFTEADIRRLTDVATSNTEFLSDARTLQFIGVVVAEYMRRHGTVITPEIADRMDAFLDGYTVPKALREPLKNMLKLENIETAVDRVEDVLQPAGLWTLRVGFTLPIVASALILLTVSFWTVMVQIFITNQYVVAWQTLSWFELARRTIGFALYVFYVLGQPTLFFVIACLVGAPFLGIRRRGPNTAPFLGMALFDAVPFTALKPTRPPDPLPGTEPPGVTLAEHGANQLRAFNDDANAYRAVHWRSLFIRTATALVTLLVAIIGVVAGIVTSIATFQYLTLIQYCVIGILTFHILWLGDDLANLIRKLLFTKEHATEAEGQHLDETIKRLRKISGTAMIIFVAAALTYVLMIAVASWAWTMATLLPVYLLLGLSVIIVSRILFGDSADAPHDVQADSAKQRRFMHKVVPAILGGLGVGLLAASFLLALSVNGFGFWQDCKGYEGTAQCSMLNFSERADSVERWTALRNNQADALENRNKPVGDTCAVAKRKLEQTRYRYNVSTVSHEGKAANMQDACERIANDDVLRKKFPTFTKACAEQQVACKN